MQSPSSTPDRRPPTASEPTISVVIPTYNRASTIARAIDSARCQTLKPVEILVVDDASTDATAGVVTRLSAETGVPVKRIVHSANQGGGAARNTGVAEATGDWIAFLDSDDRWSVDKLARQWAAVRDRPDIARCVVYCQVAIEKRRGRMLLPEVAKADATSIGDYLYVHDGLIQTSTLLLPRTLALEASIDPRLRRHQDVHLCLQLEAAGAAFVFVDAPLVAWDIDPTSHRISDSPRVEATLQFLEWHGDRLGPDARAAFESAVLAPLLGQSGQRRRAAALLFRGWREGTVGPRRLVELSARAMIPPSWMARLRSRIRPRSRATSPRR